MKPKLRIRQKTQCVAFVAVVLLFASSSAPTVAALIFSENMGTPTGTTSIAANTFQNSGNLMFSGNAADIRTTTPSTGYSEASAGGNVFLTSGGTVSFIIGSISTIGFTDLTLSFGAHKSTVASTMADFLVLQYSIDGVHVTDLPIPAQPTGSGTANWRYISGISLPSDAEGVANLQLFWSNRASSGVQFRLDDIKLEGNPVVVPEPSTWAAGVLLALPFGVHGVRCLRNRKRV